MSMTVTTESKLIPMKLIVTLAYVWLAIPVILFLINWVNLTVNALLALMIIYVGASAFIRRQKEKKNICHIPACSRFFTGSET